MVDVAIVVCLILLSLAVIALNAGCLVVIFFTHTEKRLATLLIASLLIAHMLQGVFVIPLYTVKRWKITDDLARRIVCTCFRYSYLLTNYVSCIMVLIISIDRFLAIYSPLIYRVRATCSLAVKLIVPSWMYVLVLCAIPFSRRTNKCHYNPSKLWSVLMLICNTALPFVIIILLYAYICHKSRNFIRRREIRRKSQVQEEQALRKSKVGRLLKAEFAATKIAVIIAVSYIVCWGPSLIYYLLKNLCTQCFSASFKNSLEENKINYAMKFLTMIDGLVAPVIYCLQNPYFRATVRRRVTRMQSSRSVLLETFKNDNSRGGMVSNGSSKYSPRSSKKQFSDNVPLASPTGNRLQVLDYHY